MLTLGLLLCEQQVRWPATVGRPLCDLEVLRGVVDLTDRVVVVLDRTTTRPRPPPSPLERDGAGVGEQQPRVADVLTGDALQAGPGQRALRVLLELGAGVLVAHQVQQEVDDLGKGQHGFHLRGT